MKINAEVISIFIILNNFVYVWTAVSKSYFYKANVNDCGSGCYDVIATVYDRSTTGCGLQCRDHPRCVYVRTVEEEGRVRCDLLDTITDNSNNTASENSQHPNDDVTFMHCTSCFFFK